MCRFFVGEYMKENIFDTKNQFYLNESDFLYLNLAIEKAKESFCENEVPIGAVLVYDGNVVIDHNRKVKNNLCTAHAEINVINKMCHLVGDWRLNGATLYITMSPCLMCIGAIIEARISKIVYGCGNPLNDKYLSLLRERGIIVVGPVDVTTCGNLLSNFFKEKRN